MSLGIKQTDGSIAYLPTNNNTVSFTEPTTLTEMASGDTHAVLMGKIKKTFKDKTVKNFTQITLSSESTSNMESAVSALFTELIKQYPSSTNVMGNVVIGTTYFLFSGNITANNMAGTLTRYSSILDIYEVFYNKSNTTGYAEKLYGNYSTVPNNTDINTLKSGGTYYLYASYTYTNLPSGVTSGWIEIKHSAGSSGAKQVLYRLGTVGTNDYEVYTRTTTNSGSTWSDWVRLITTKDTVTTSANGLMSSTDKTKLDNVISGSSFKIYTGSRTSSGTTISVTLDSGYKAIYACVTPIASTSSPSFKSMSQSGTTVTITLGSSSMAYVTVLAIKTT